MHAIRDPSYRRAVRKGPIALRDWYLAQLERVRQSGDGEDEWVAIYRMIHSAAFAPDRDRVQLLTWYRRMLELPTPSAQRALYVGRWLHEWVKDDDLALQFVATGYEAFWRK